MKRAIRISSNVAVRSENFQSLLASFRAGEWWEHKLVPIIMMFYATGLMLEASLARLWPSLLILLFALVPGAAYVSVINDFTDRAEDLIAGKANRLAGRSRGAIIAFIGIPVALGLLFVAQWHNDPLLLLFYIAAWLSFSLYSLPPFRLKVRGLAGVFADAAGAHLFPTLLAVVLAFRSMGRSVDPYWLGTVAIWALAYGLRGILWHQLNDLENDRIARVPTFAQRHPPRTVAALAKFIILPVELSGFSALLWQVGSPLPGIALALYAAMIAAQVHWLAMHATIVGTPPRFLIVMREYYGVFFPIAVLLASSLRYPSDLAILGAHLLLFPRSVVHTTADFRRLLYQARIELRQSLYKERLQRSQKR